MYTFEDNNDTTVCITFTNLMTDTPKKCWPFFSNKLKNRYHYVFLYNLCKREWRGGGTKKEIKRRRKKKENPDRSTKLVEIR